MLLIQILIVGFLFVTERVVDAFSICDAKNFMQIAKEQNETFYVFALTQVGFLEILSTFVLKKHYQLSKLLI